MMPASESEFLHSLEAEVEVEFGEVESSHPEEPLSVTPAEWLFDPSDVEREEVGLRNLLGAVEAMERGVEADHSREAERGAPG